MTTKEEKVLEVRGSDVNQAISAGLAELGLNRDDVQIEVLDEGSAGFLGIGSRDAVVRLVAEVEAGIQDSNGRQQEPAPPVVEEVPQPVAPVIEDVPEAVVEVEPEPADEPDAADEPEIGDEEEEEDEVAVATEIVSELLALMQVKAEIEITETEEDDLTGDRLPLINISGQDLGMLIGARGETLNSLQYISRLMTGHIIHRRPQFIIDVEGYRKRREQALTRLAQRMAEKAVSSGRAITLEPMPPNERRVIHMALREHDAVYTESTGEGRGRKVRVLLK